MEEMLRSERWQCFGKHVYQIAIQRIDLPQNHCGFQFLVVLNFLDREKGPHDKALQYPKRKRAISDKQNHRSKFIFSFNKFFYDLHDINVEV